MAKVLICHPYLLVSPERERIDYPEEETREDAQICSNTDMSYLENTQDQHWRTGEQRSQLKAQQVKAKMLKLLIHGRIKIVSVL